MNKTYDPPPLIFYSTHNYNCVGTMQTIEEYDETDMKPYSANGNGL